MHSLSEICNDSLFVGPKSRQREQRESLNNFIIILKGAQERLAGTGRGGGGGGFMNRWRLDCMSVECSVGLCGGTWWVSQWQSEV